MNGVVDGVCWNSFRSSPPRAFDSHLIGLRCGKLCEVNRINLKSSRASPSIHCRIRFRPCIDIHKGKVKQIVGSTLQDLNQENSSPITNFESDKSASEFAELYKQDGLTGGHVIMLGADRSSVSTALEALHAFPGGLHIGGGINCDNAQIYLDEGASHVIVTSFVFKDGKMEVKRLKDLVKQIWKTRLVLDLSCRKKDGNYVIVTDRWQKFSDVILDEATLGFVATYADEFLVHGVDVEGKRSRHKECPFSSFSYLYFNCAFSRLGIDEELVALLGQLSPISVTYAGGVTTMSDLERIKSAGLGHVDVTVGSSLDIFGGDLSYKAVVEWHRHESTAIH